ncbi:MAG: hypothetical protein WBW68_18455, partial [Terracidiphilus sp.]
KGQLTGMLGVYLTAAELTNRGFIVSPTSRSAAGANLLVTDPKCQKAWSVQVKTQRQAANYWLVGSQAREINSPTHIYVFINLRGDNRPEYLVVPSEVVAEKMYLDEGKRKTGNKFHWFGRNAGKEFVAAQGWKDRRQEGWEIFGSPS